MKNFEIKKVNVTEDNYVEVTFILKQKMTISIKPKYDDDLDEEIVAIDVNNITEKDIMNAIENTSESELGDMFLSSLE